MEYTLSELMNVIKNDEIYIPIENHRLLKRVYLENDSIVFEFYPNVNHVGLGIDKNKKFKRVH